MDPENGVLYKEIKKFLPNRDFYKLNKKFHCSLVSKLILNGKV